jgi:hypothetical protein
MRIKVVPCTGHADAVDLVDTGAGTDADPLHLPVWEWEEFKDAVKDGKFDGVDRRPAPR